MLIESKFSEKSALRIGKIVLLLLLHLHLLTIATDEGIRLNHGDLRGICLSVFWVMCLHAHVSSLENRWATCFKRIVFAR